MVTPATLYAGAQLVGGVGEYYAAKAEAINTQTANLLRANDVLFATEIQAMQGEEYARIQAGRTIQQANITAMNQRMIGNKLLRDHRQSVASARARAAANGVAFNEGSVAAFENENLRQTMMDVGVSDFNALTALVFGFEDATALLQSQERQATMSLYSAQSQAQQYRMAGEAARTTGRLKGGQALLESGYKFYQLYPGASGAKGKSA